NMPGMTGPEICRRLRDERPLASVYVVMLTSRESPQDAIAGLDAGADDYVLKPFDRDQLRARVDVGVRVLTLQETLSNRVAELQEALSKVTQLEGLLPICSYCKCIRRDDQYWQQVEAYIAERSDARFTHGICPACFERVTRQFDDIRGRSNRVP